MTGRIRVDRGDKGGKDELEGRRWTESVSGQAGLRVDRLFFSFSFFHILCLCATLWVMTDLLSVLYVYFQTWRKAPYFITISALSMNAKG